MEKTHKPGKTDWTPHALETALIKGSVKDKVAVLKRAGILTENGQLSSKYKNWGEKPSRTPDDE